MYDAIHVLRSLGEGGSVSSVFLLKNLLPGRFSRLTFFVQAVFLQLKKRSFLMVDSLKYNKWLWFGAGLLWGAVLVFACGIFFLRHALIAETESPLPWEKAVEEFPRLVMKQPGWIVRTVPCGLPVPVKGARIMVFEICSRKFAGAILNDPDARKTAAVLPCKIAIYERGGKTFIARLNAPVFMRLLGGTPAEVFAGGILPEQSLMLDPLLFPASASKAGSDQQSGSAPGE